MLVGEGLVRLLPVSAEILMCSEARVCKCLQVSHIHEASQLLHLKL